MCGAIPSSQLTELTCQPFDLAQDGSDHHVSFTYPIDSYYRILSRRFKLYELKKVLSIFFIMKAISIPFWHGKFTESVNFTVCTLHDKTVSIKKLTSEIAFFHDILENPSSGAYLPYSVFK